MEVKIRVEEIYNDFVNAYLKQFEKYHYETAKVLKKYDLFRIEVVFPIPSVLHLFILKNIAFAEPDPVYKRFYNLVQKFLGEIDWKISLLSYLNEKFDIRVTVDKWVVEVLKLNMKGSVIWDTMLRYYCKVENVVDWNKFGIKQMREISKAIAEKWNSNPSKNLLYFNK